MEVDDVEGAPVEVNRQAREEAGAARQPRAGGPEDLPVGEATTGDDDDADVGGAARGTESMARGAGSAVPMPESSSGGAARSTAP